LVNLQIKLLLELRTPLHTSGDKPILWVDRGTYLDASKNPSIPATSLKGVIRYSTEKFLRTYEEEKACYAPKPGDMCNCCIVCIYFGSPRNKARLKFHDLKPVSEYLLDTRVGTGVNRRRKVVEEDHLFTLETAWVKEFRTEIDGLFDLEEDAKEAASLVYGGLKLAFAIGGVKSRGLGWMKVKDFKANIDYKEISIEDLQLILEDIVTR